MSAGKGNRPRPMQVSEEEFAERWKRTFMHNDPQDAAPDHEKVRLQVVERDAFESLEVGLAGHELREAREALDFIREEYARLKAKVATLRKNWPPDATLTEEE